MRTSASVARRSRWTHKTNLKGEDPIAEERRGDRIGPATLAEDRGQPEKRPASTGVVDEDERRIVNAIAVQIAIAVRVGEGVMIMSVAKIDRTFSR